MDKFLKEDERLDDLQFNNLYIIQNKKGYCFTSDAVKLANFALVKNKKFKYFSQQFKSYPLDKSSFLTPSKPILSILSNVIQISSNAFSSNPA